MGVIENIQSLITAANATTSKSDTDMTSATKSLIAGYGGSGKPEEVKTVDIITNGKTEILPTPGSVMSKVVANVNVPTGGSSELLKSILEGTATKVVLPADITIIRPHCFEKYKSLEEFDFSHIALIKENAFVDCTSIRSIELPVTEEVGARAFMGCTALTQVHISQGVELTSAKPSVFEDCTMLKKFDADKIVSFGPKTFLNCNSLNTVILRRPKAVRLPYKGIFTGTPLEDGTGYIYVPKILVDEYKAATNWVTFAAQFRAIEDYPDITGG